jgi:hypothetical protein
MPDLSVADIEHNLRHGSGVHVQEGFLSAQECDDLIDVIKSYEPDRFGSLRCLLDKSPIFLRIATDPLITGICGQLFGIEHRLSALGARVIERGTDDSFEHRHVLSPHIDYPYPSVIGEHEGESGKFFGMHFGLQVLLPLADMGLENGATAYLPGSQKWYRRPDREQFAQAVRTGEAKRLVVPRGTIAMWSGPLWHSAMPTTVDESRVMVTMLFSPSFINHPHRMRDNYSREFIDGLSPELRKLIGVDDFNAMVFEHPNKRIHQTEAV